jgi:hypothetical protein
MERNPKKTKAFIITFIVVMVLLIGGYFLFKNSSQIFGTKNGTDGGKTFSPLLGSSDPKDLSAVDKDGVPIDTTSGQGGISDGAGETTSGSTNSSVSTNGVTSTGALISSGIAVGSGSGISNSGFITPPFKPLPSPTNAGTVTTSTNTNTPTNTPTTTGVITPTVTTPTTNPNTCITDDPLVFTDAEKTELDALLRQYYLIAPNLKLDDDLALVDNDIITNQSLIDQANSLTNQCEIQKSSLGYTGPQTVKDNPYYSNSSGSFYLPEFSQLEDLFNIW